MKSVSDIESYFKNQKLWKDELLELRAVLSVSGLEETLKWGTPVYTFKGKNVVGIGSFKSYFGLWFFQGALLKDADNVLINAQEGKTKALRQWRFLNSKEMNASLIKEYINEAIKNQRAGKEIKPDRNKKLKIPQELQHALKKDPKLRSQFDLLSPYKQREFADHISDAKREATRIKRLEKSISLIYMGVGLHDKYKK